MAFENYSDPVESSDKARRPQAALRKEEQAKESTDPRRNKTSLASNALQFVTADSTVRFNSYEVNARYALTPALALGAAYTYTDVKGYIPGPNNNDHAKYHQVGLQTDYSLSKRTDIYAEGVVQLAKQGAVAQVFGSNAPAVHGNQVVVSTGLRHRF